MPRIAASVFAFCAMAAAAAFTADRAIAQPTSTGTISLQGRLTGVADGARQLTFFLHDAETGGTQVASVGPIAATVTGGAFSSNIAVPAGTFDGRTLWWSVAVDGGAATARQLVTSVPYAIGLGPVSISDFDPRVVRIGQAIAICDSPVLAPVLPPDGERVEGRWGTYIVARNDTDRFISIGVSNDSWSKAEVRLDNSNEAWGRIAFLTNEGNSSPVTRMLINEDGNVGIGTTTPNEKLDVDGRARVDVLIITGGSDLAEPFSASPAKSQAVKPKPGMVMSIDPEHPGALRVATTAYDTAVAGVYSGGNGLPTGMVMGKEGCDLTAPGDDKLPLAMTGRVWVYADESNGPIKPGDRLTTSADKPGHAMRVSDETRSIGAVIGKAMTGVDRNTGMVLVLVNLQ